MTGDFFYFLVISCWELGEADRSIFFLVAILIASFVSWRHGKPRYLAPQLPRQLTQRLVRFRFLVSLPVSACEHTQCRHEGLSSSDKRHLSDCWRECVRICGTVNTTELLRGRNLESVVSGPNALFPVQMHCCWSQCTILAL